jgi:hypothetical protein
MILFLSVSEIEALVRDLGYVNDLRYWCKIGDSDMDELGKSLTNDEHVLDFLNIVEIYKLEGVQLYVKHRVDKPDGDVQNGHVNE